MREKEREREREKEIRKMRKREKRVWERTAREVVRHKVDDKTA